LITILAPSLVFGHCIYGPVAHVFYSTQGLIAAASEAVPPFYSNGF